MIRVISQKIGKEHTQLLWWFWSWLLPAAILGAIGIKVLHSPEQLAILREMEVANWTGLFACLVLLPINLLLESHKWQIILQPVDRKSLLTCAKIILSGRSLNVITPFGVGNVFAKYVSTTRKHRSAAIGAMLLDTLSGLLPTLALGMVSFYYLLEKGLEFPVGDTATFVIPVCALVVVAMSVIRYNHRKKLERYLTLLATLNLKSALQIIGISTLRYAVFTLQFYCLFVWLGSRLPNEVLLLGIAWIFLIKTILPGLSVLGDLVKRELSAVLFFSFFTEELTMVLVASFVIWLVNITIPAILGIGFVKTYKEAL